MICYEIKNAVCDLELIFLEAGYTEKTITEHKRNIQKVVDLHHNHDAQLYSPEIVNHYISRVKEMYESGAISRSRKNALVKAALYVHEIANTGKIKAGVKELQDKLPPYYRTILEEIKSSDDWSESLNRNIVFASHTYFLFPCRLWPTGHQRGYSRNCSQLYNTEGLYDNTE